MKITKTNDFKILTSIKSSKILRDQSDSLSKEVNKKIFKKEVKIIEKLFILRLFKNTTKHATSTIITKSFVTV